mmetsp:Transcript_30690/g.89671  ORF Transcript_30690/g.89671 Transcript_30690/m.89671 type:complete len:501 (-) Transcript_30690:43-1545(-)
MVQVGRGALSLRQISDRAFARCGSVASEELRRCEARDALAHLVAQQPPRGRVVDRRCDEERRPLELLDRVDVLLDHRVEQRLVEGVRGGDHDVQRAARDRQRARARERVEQVKGGLLLALLLLGVQRLLLRLAEQRLLRPLRPRLAHLNRCGPDRGAALRRQQLRVERRGDLGVVELGRHVVRRVEVVVVRLRLRRPGDGRWRSLCGWRRKRRAGRWGRATAGRCRPGCARSDRHLDSAMAGGGGAACGKEAGRGAASALEAAGIAAQRCLIGIGRHCCESRLSGEEASGARVTKRLRVLLMKWLLHHRLLPGGMQLALLGRLDHLVDGGDVPTHGLELLFGRRSGGPGVGEQVGRDLVLDEEVEQLLRERDLLGQRVVGQLEQRLELRLELDDEDAEDGPLELHRAVRLGEALLLRRQARDRVAELRRRRQRLEHQRDVDRVLVLQDEGVLQLEGACRPHTAEQQHERGELPRACAQHEYRRTGTGARRGRRPPVRWRW